LNIERIPSAEWPRRLFSEWSRLLDEASVSEVFLSPEWTIAWMRHYGDEREALLITARDESGALLGLAPFYRRRLGPGVLSGPRVLAFLGDEGVGSEYLGILARKVAEEQFLSALAHEMKGQWSLADLRGLKERHPSSDRLIKVLGADAPDRIHRERHPCSSVALPGDYEAYLTSLAAKFRTTVRYRTNKLVKNFKVRMLRTSRPEELDGHLERFFVMHQGRWEAEGHSGSFYNPRKRAFYREVADGFLRRGWLRFYHLEVDGVIRAAQFGFAFRGVLHSLQEAFDRDFRPPGVGGVGVVLRGMAIRESIEEGLGSYDFLGGVEEYKIRWGTTEHYVQRARIGAPGAAGALSYLSTAKLRDARLWVRGHLPGRLVEARDRWRVRRQARKARELAARSDETAP